MLTIAPFDAIDSSTRGIPEVIVGRVVVETPDVQGRFALRFLDDQPLEADEVAGVIETIAEHADTTQNRVGFHARYAIGQVYRRIPPYPGKINDVRALLPPDFPHQSSTFLHECATLFDHFADQDALQAWMDRADREHGRVTVTALRAELYPHRDQVAIEEQQTPKDEARGLLEDAENLFQAGERRLERIQKLLPEGDPLRETAEVLLAETRRELEHQRAVDRRGPVRSKPYRRFVSSRPCEICGIEATDEVPNQPHHVGHLGTAEKNSDGMCVSHCDTHHGEVEENGEEWMERTYAPFTYRNAIIRTALAWGLAEQDTNIFIPFYLK